MSNIEHEKRFLVPISNLGNLKNELIKKGVVEIGSFLQERIVFDVDDVKMRWGRLRTNGSVTTLAIKEKVNGVVTETEVAVSDFQVMANILRMMGIVFKAQHQNHRTQLEFENEDLNDIVKISLDAWPELFLKIGYILEIEATSEEDLILAISILGLSPDDITEHEVWDLYETQGLEEIMQRDLVFSDEELELIGI